MIKIAVMGYGVVGSGVVELCEKGAAVLEKKLNDTIEVKYILDIRDFADDKNKDKFVKDFSVIENDAEISVVAETIGGCGKAYEFTKKCLLAKKSVVTSNKELVAEKGTELSAIASENGVSYLFEASVGGGIPIIRPLRDCLAADRIDRIVGILNGTTNYILTKMKKENLSFDDALQSARQLGYAEANPAADIEGIDTCRKICILAALAFGKRIPPENVDTVGISGVTLDDVFTAESNGYAVKLLGYAGRKNDKIRVFVHPCAVPLGSTLAGIDDVFNGICVEGSAVGDVTFCGRGAGRLPTASAVWSDIVSAATGSGYESKPLWTDCGSDFLVSFDKNEYRCIEGTNIPVIE